MEQIVETSHDYYRSNGVVAGDYCAAGIVRIHRRWFVSQPDGRGALFSTSGRSIVMPALPMMQPGCCELVYVVVA